MSALLASKYLLPLLKVKWLIGALGPFVSLLASSIAYTWVFGWSYGLGIIGLIFIHECGHGIAMLHCKMNPGPMIFIPFLGAAVEMKDLPPSAFHEAYIALAGPVIGSVAAMVPLGYGILTGSQIALALGHFGAMINLFNLMPVGMMDGGRVAGCLHPALLPVGVVVGAAAMYLVPMRSPILTIMLILGAIQSYSRLYGSDQRPPQWYRMKPQQRLLVVSTYVSLVGGLLWVMDRTNKQLKSPNELRGRGASRFPPPEQGGDDGDFLDWAAEMDKLWMQEERRYRNGLSSEWTTEPTSDGQLYEVYYVPNPTMRVTYV
eukprot:Filipodium_phascolosomae@DN2242_c0_g1_i1.p1